MKTHNYKHYKLRCCLFLVFSGLHVEALAQEQFKLSGLAYIDYAYTLESPDEASVGENGFSYRRIYLTTDFDISEQFSARARFEISNSSTTADGKPSPFVKDAYVKWKNAWREGHDLTFGVVSPPSFTVAEKTWGYRSLDKTLMDRLKIVSSRDFGFLAKGRLVKDGSLRYGLMFANNNSTGQENDRYKRMYGQLEWYPTEELRFTVGADYAGFEAPIHHELNLNSHIGYVSEQMRLGAELFYLDVDGSVSEDDAYQIGFSAFATFRIDDRWSTYFRFDDGGRHIENGVTSDMTYILGGLDFRPHNNVHLMPNVLYIKEHAESTPEVTPRLTVHVDF